MIMKQVQTMKWTNIWFSIYTANIDITCKLFYFSKDRIVTSQVSFGNGISKLRVIRVSKYAGFQDPK